MFSRIVSTGLLLLLAAGAFIAAASFTAAGDLSAFVALGLFWLALAVVNWFIWETLRAGWKYGRSAADDDLPLSGWFWPQYFRSAFRILAPPKPDRPGAARRDPADRQS